MAQQGKGGLIRIVVLVAVLAAAAGGFFFMQQQKTNLNSVEKIEAFVNGGGLLRKTLDEAKATLGHNNPVAKAGEQDVYVFDMREKDPELAVLVEVVMRGGVVAAHRTYDAEGVQTGS
ncbi:MAG: hypothetical protein ACF8R7_01630 [Phycisphaerales bacterium JB039]